MSFPSRALMEAPSFDPPKNVRAESVSLYRVALPCIAGSSTKVFQPADGCLLPTRSIPPRLAECNSAIQQIENLRYDRCARPSVGREAVQALGHAGLLAVGVAAMDDAGFGRLVEGGTDRA